MDNLVSEFKINIFKIIKISLSYGELLPFKNKVIEQLRHLYLKKVGKVVFPTVIMRPNNTHTISKLAEFLINLSLNYLKVIDHNIYYLVLNKYLAIEYKVKNEDNKLIAIMDKVFTVATNVSYGNHPDRRSRKGHIFKLFKGIINWLSRKQLTVIILITEAELLSITHIAKTLFWWKKIFAKLDFWPNY